MPGRKGNGIWSPEAFLDLDQIWDYYERVAGRNTAERIIRKIGEVIANDRRPSIHRPVTKRIASRGSIARSDAARRLLSCQE